jgi:hypothetical protein
MGKYSDKYHLAQRGVDETPQATPAGVGQILKKMQVVRFIGFSKKKETQSKRAFLMTFICLHMHLFNMHRNNQNFMATQQRK